MDRTEQNITETVAAVSAEIAKADTKAGLILTLDGLLVAALSLGRDGGDGGAAGLAMQAVGAAALTGSVLLALAVIRPRLAPGGPKDRSFVNFASIPTDAVAALMQEDERIVRIQVLSRIALRKMRTMRIAADCAFIATAAIATAAILTR